MLEDFDTYEKITNCFGRINALGNNNCIFMGFVDTSKNIITSTIAGNVIGGIAGDITHIVTYATLESIDRSMNELYNYHAILINETENGMVFLPTNAGLSYKDAVPLYDKAVLVPWNMVESITVKKYSIFLNNCRSVRIKIANVPEFRLIVYYKDKKLPYHEGNATNFLKKYEKK